MTSKLRSRDTLAVGGLLVASVLAPDLPDHRGHTNPADLPSITTISPTRIDLGTNGATLTVNGASFTRNSVVRLNGVDRVTTYVGPAQLQATIPASDLVSATIHSVAVYNPGGNGGTSNTRTLEVVYPVPVVSTLSPSPAPLGGEPFTLVVTGSRFYPTAMVLWNNAARPTTFDNAERLTALISASDVATATSADIRVSNPGAISASRPLTISLVTPAITSLAPASRKITPGLDFKLRVNGQGFLRSGSTVRWNGQARPTTWVSATQLDATIPYSDVVTAGTARVTVFSSIAGTSKESAQASFEVLNPPVSASGSSPYALRVGDPGQQVTITGQGFLPGVTTAHVNGRSPGGSVSSYTRMYVGVQSQDLDSLGTITVEVTNPPPGGGTSTEQISVINPPATLLSLTPTSAARGGAAFTLTVRGSRLVLGAVVRWNGSDRPTTRVNSTELRASIPAADLTRSGDARITVFNPAPGGGESNALTVTVLEQAIRIPD